MRARVLGQSEKRGRRLKEPSSPRLFCTQMPWGSVLSPGLLPTSCHKAGEESVLHYLRSRLPQAYGQQTPSLEHHGKCLLLTPTLAQLLLSLEHRATGSVAPTTPLPTGCRTFSHCSKSHLGFIALDERGGRHQEKRRGSDGPVTIKCLILQPRE